MNYEKSSSFVEADVFIWPKSDHCLALFLSNSVMFGNLIMGLMLLRLVLRKGVLDIRYCLAELEMFWKYYYALFGETKCSSWKTQESMTRWKNIYLHSWWRILRASRCQQGRQYHRCGRNIYSQMLLFCSHSTQMNSIQLPNRYKKCH